MKDEELLEFLEERMKVLDYNVVHFKEDTLKFGMNLAYSDVYHEVHGRMKNETINK